MERAREDRPARAGGDAEEARVAQGPTRCPFCHEDVQDATAWVACAGCLARHHASCWDEGARCGACGSVTKLAVVAPPGPSDEAREVMVGDGRPAEASRGQPSSKAWVTSRVCLAAQALGFVVVGTALLGLWGRGDRVGVLGALGLFLGSGVGALVPLAAAVVGLGSRRRMAVQGAISGGLFAGWWLLWFAAPALTSEPSTRIRVWGVGSLLFAAITAFLVSAMPSPSPRSAGPG